MATSESSPSGRLEVNRGVVRADEKLDWKRLIRVTNPSPSAEGAALGYKNLTEVGGAFRTTKLRLDIAPMHHRLDERIWAHDPLLWLGLLPVRVIEPDSGMTLDRARDEMDEVSLNHLARRHGRAVIVSNLTDSQRENLKRLNLNALETALSI